MLDELWTFLWLVFVHWGAYVIGGTPWALDEAAKRLSDGYRKWAEKEDTRALRRRIEVIALLGGILFASFQAWDVEYTTRQSSDRAAQLAQKDDAVQRQRADDLDRAINGPGGYRDQLAVKPKDVFIPAPSVPVAKAPPSASLRDPDTLYQLGSPVGTVTGAHVLLSTSTIEFDEVDGDANLNQTQPIEYRDYILRIVNTRGVAGLIIGGTSLSTKNGVLQQVVCAIIGRRKS